MKCPVCINESLVMSERSGIEIDYCPKCRGVWLDRGELDKIIERSESKPATNNLYNQNRSPSYDNHNSHNNHSYNQKNHKKESFWSELFD